MDILVFMDISLQLSMLLWISIWISLDFYGYPCTDLLWILDPALVVSISLFHPFILFSKSYKYSSTKLHDIPVR